MGSKMTESEIEEAKECFLILESFKHLDEVKDLIHSVPGIINDNSLIERTEEKIKYIFDLYQEQPHLLDPYLEEMLMECITIIRNQPSCNSIFHCMFRIIYLMVKTRGYKSIVRLFPHEVSDLEPTIKLLSEQDPENSMEWQTRYVLLLWLSIVSMIPFDLTRLDVPNREPVRRRILELGKIYVKSKDSSQTPAAFMLSRFLCRPDSVTTMLSEGVAWACEEIKTGKIITVRDQIQLSGVYRFLANLFKYGKRDDLLPYANPALAANNCLDLSQCQNINLKKMRAKLIQRIGLIYLRVRVASWRYNRGNRSLALNLAPLSRPDAQTANQLGDGNVANPDEEEDDDEELPEELNDVIDSLITSLKDRDTVVRWSAAKGIGRVCSRLNKGLADDVVEAVLVLFSRLEGFSSWHGGCLALAELGRRGLLLPERLPQVVPLIVKALFYDEKTGDFSYGANVRDAACYVCWSFARAYDPKELTNYVFDIAISLVLLTLFDREVNVRRAAAAAFQENVGRQGQFPHGIDILTNCDYFAVGNRVNCFLELSVFVAQFEEYIVPLINHLTDLKIKHWDSAVRELTAKALFNLTPFAKTYIIENVFSKVLPFCNGMDLYLRHGAILAIGELIYGIANNNAISSEVMEGVKAIARKLHENQQFRGMSGELMRKAVCSLIDRCSLANLPFHDDTILDLWQEILIECMQHKEKTVQNAAIDAFPHFVSAFFKTSDGNAIQDKTDALIQILLDLLTSSQETSQMGSLRALGTLDVIFLNGSVSIIIKNVLDCTRITSKTEKWGEARRESVKTTVCILKNIGLNHPELNTSIMNNIFDSFDSAMADYTIDARGDIGAIVRESTMESIAALCSYIMTEGRSDILGEEIIRKCFCHVIQQSVEKIDRTRSIAGGVFISLLHQNPPLPHIPHEDDLKSIFSIESTQDMNWAAPHLTFPLFTQVLKLDTYRYNLVLGLVVSVGGLTESTLRYSSESLRTRLQENSDNKEYLSKFISAIVKVFENYTKDDRISKPLLKFLDFVFHDSVLIAHLETDEESLQQLLELTRNEVHKSNDVHKIKAAIDCYCGLLQFAGEIKRKSLGYLMMMLGHQFPVIRKNTASKFYEALMMTEVTEDEEKLDQIMEILTETIWEEDLKEVRQTRNKVCELLELPIPKPLPKATA